MARPRKPTAVLALSGALTRDKKRHAHRLNEPKPSRELGPPPAHFAAEERGLWAELLRKAPPGVLTVADELVLEMTVSLMLKLRNRSIKGAEYSQLQSCLRSMGMTPADRSRVHSDEPQRVPDEWDQFIDALAPQRQ